MTENILPIKKDSTIMDGKFKFSVIELLLLRDVLNQRETRGYGLKDIRLIDKAAQAIKAVTPESPKEGFKTQQEADQWAMQIIECELTQSIFDTLKMKFVAFQGFLNDERNRAIILSLSDKLGIKG